MNKKHLTMSTLIALALLVVAFTPISSQQGVHDYDPWADINGDGKMDGKDIAFTAAGFGTLGDPTRNVNVINLPLDGNGNLRVNVTKQNPTLRTDSQAITLIDSRGKEIWGTVAQTGFGWDNIYWTYFSFNTKGVFNNVTRIILRTLQSQSGSSSINISIWLGDIDIADNICFQYLLGYLFPTDPAMNYFAFMIDSWYFDYYYNGQLLLESIKPGINVARMDGKLRSGSPTTVYTYKVELYIEYTYWDYS